jgi:peroxiredoxin
MSTTRRGSFLGALAATAGAALLPRSSLASGAISGSYCLPVNPRAQHGIIPFELPVLGAPGQTMRSTDITGKSIWLNFFASWCGDCNVEMSDILSVYAKYRDAGLTLIGIDVAEPTARATDFRDRFHVPYPILMDTNGAVFSRFVGSNHLPTHLFYNESRTLTCLGIEGFTAKDLDNEVSVALE